jgi:hypothetical protein
MNEENPKTLSVPTAGRRYFGLGKNASYAAAARGEMPVIRVGSRLRAPIVALDRMLEETKPRWNKPATLEKHSRSNELVTGHATQSEAAMGEKAP